MTARSWRDHNQCAWWCSPTDFLVAIECLAQAIAGVNGKPIQGRVVAVDNALSKTEFESRVSQGQEEEEEQEQEEKEEDSNTLEGVEEEEDESDKGSDEEEANEGEESAEEGEEENVEGDQSLLCLVTMCWWRLLPEHCEYNLLLQRVWTWTPPRRKRKRTLPVHHPRA